MKILLIIILLSWVNVSQAWQVMKDPTRPVAKPQKPTAGDGATTVQDGAIQGAGFGQDDVVTFPSAKLTAIVVTDQSKYAIINNEVVYEGQPWRNVILSRVNPYSIILKLGDLEKEITINKTDFIIESNYDN